jgi:hypothetical protein
MIHPWHTVKVGIYWGIVGLPVYKEEAQDAKMVYFVL